MPRKSPHCSPRLSIRIPASTSNLGPGYDCLGLAFALYNTFHVEALAPGCHECSSSGPERLELPCGENNLFVQSAHLLYAEYERRFGRPRGGFPGIRVQAVLHIPATRGLGSSTTAVLGGLLAANALLASRFSREDIQRIAGAFERHPDNVTPSLLGGLCAGVMHPDGAITWLRRRLHRSIQCVVVIPEYQVPTQRARRAIPKRIPHADAIFNLTRIPLLLERLTTGCLDDLAFLMEDRLHEPYRKPLMRAYDDVVAAGSRAGAAAVVLSGAGSALLALCRPPRGDRVGRAMVRAFHRADTPARYLLPRPDSAGARIHFRES